MTFDEWWNNSECSRYTDPLSHVWDTAQGAWNARQEEIDKLKEEISELRKQLNLCYDSNDYYIP